LKNAQGTRVPSGSYLVVLQAASDDGQQTQALRSVTVNR
jgi:hypothetical protein